MDRYTSYINKSIEDLFNALEKRYLTMDMKRVREAYDWLVRAYKDQKRKTGEPCIVHPIAVAQIVAENFKLDANSVIAAFLHDVTEYTSYTFEDIRRCFGTDVGTLVALAAKRKKEKFDYSKADYFRQMLEAVQYNIRAILIKLADNLYNMRTLANIEPDKRMKTVGESDFFYAPLAKSLGLYYVMSELENLSFRYRYPLEYAQVEQNLAVEQKSLRLTIDDFIHKVEKLLEANNINARVEVCYRSPYNIWCKMKSKNCDFKQVDEKHYIHIIYPAWSWQEETQIVFQIYGILSGSFKECPGSVKNYVNSPTKNDYQSFHVKLLNADGGWEKVHISSERMAYNSKMGYIIAKFAEYNDTYGWKPSCKFLLKDIASNGYGMDDTDCILSSSGNDEIQVFTSEGKGIILPKNATVLDFAFAIHSKIGLHALYARINGCLSSVKTVLHRGDCVEIGTNKQVEPEEEWLHHVCTHKAKSALRSYFNKREKLVYRRCDCCRPLPGEDVVGFKNPDGTITLHKRNCNEAICRVSKEEDSIVFVNFEENTAFLFPVRIRIRGVDRQHLLNDIVSCITECHNLPVSKLNMTMEDRIVELSVDFSVHSVMELQQIMDSITVIDYVDEVSKMNIY